MSGTPQSSHQRLNRLRRSAQPGGAQVHFHGPYVAHPHPPPPPEIMVRTVMRGSPAGDSGTMSRLYARCAKRHHDVGAKDRGVGPRVLRTGCGDLVIISGQKHAAIMVSWPARPGTRVMRRPACRMQRNTSAPGWVCGRWLRQIGRLGQSRQGIHRRPMLPNEARQSVGTASSRVPVAGASPTRPRRRDRWLRLMVRA